MIKKLTLFLVLFLVVASISFSGCGKKVIVTNAPAGVDPVSVANWYKATGAFSNIADLTLQAEQTLHQANTQGILPDGEYYQKLLITFGKIALTEKSAAEYLKTVPNAFGQPVQAKVGIYTKAIQGFTQDLISLGVTGIKNPNTQQLVNQLISEIGSAVQFILSFTSSAELMETVPEFSFAANFVLKEVYVV